MEQLSEKEIFHCIKSVKLDITYGTPMGFCAAISRWLYINKEVAFSAADVFNNCECLYKLFKPFEPAIIPDNGYWFNINDRQTRLDIVNKILSELRSK